MIKNQPTYIYLIGIVLMFSMHVSAQVKIGDNHQSINAGSLLELESASKGVAFPRVMLDNNLSVWKLDGAPMDGMVVFNLNTTLNKEGLYCWYNNQWNHFSSGGDIKELDTLSFNTDTRVLYDDGDEVEIPSGRVVAVASKTALLASLSSGNTIEGDIYYVSNDGLYVRNGLKTAATVRDAFLYVSASQKAGRILYAKYSTAEPTHNMADFALGSIDSFYQEPEDPQVINVDLPSAGVNDSYYAFAVPRDWANPRIFLKVKDSADQGFYKLDNCWTVTRELEYDGIQYQVWTMNVRMRESVMDVINSKAQFMIE